MKMVGLPIKRLCRLSRRVIETTETRRYVSVSVCGWRENHGPFPAVGAWWNGQAWSAPLFKSRGVTCSADRRPETKKKKPFHEIRPVFILLFYSMTISLQFHSIQWLSWLFHIYSSPTPLALQSVWHNTLNQNNFLSPSTMSLSKDTVSLLLQSESFLMIESTLWCVNLWPCWVKVRPTVVSAHSLSFISTSTTPVNIDTLLEGRGEDEANGLLLFILDIN